MTDPLASGGLGGGPSPSGQIARDMARRGLFLMPVVFVVAMVVFDTSVAISMTYAMAIVLLNFLASAYLLAWAARISLGLVPSVALGGYAMRLALVFVAVWLVRETSWVRMVPLGLTIISTHLGLLVWELRYISASFTHPGLKPTSSSSSVRKSRPAAGYQPDHLDNKLKPVTD